MTKQQIDELRKLEQALNAKTWKAVYHREDYGQGYGETIHYINANDYLIKIGCDNGNNEQYIELSMIAKFMAAIRNSAPELVELAARSEALEEILKHSIGACGYCVNCDDDGNSNDINENCRTCSDDGMENWEFDYDRFGS